MYSSVYQITYTKWQMCTGAAGDRASCLERPSLGPSAELPGPSGTPSGELQGLGVGAEEQGGALMVGMLHDSGANCFFWS